MPRGNQADVESAVQAAHKAYTQSDWASFTPTQRGALLRKLGDLVARDAEKLAATEVRDNGKLLAEMRGQLNYIPQWFYYYGGLADKRSEEHTSELQSLMRISFSVFCLNTKYIYTHNKQ